MPKLTGASHAFAALGVLLLAPLLRRVLELLVTEEDILSVVGATAALLQSYSFVPVEGEAATTVAHLALLTLLAFLWGYAYHWKRHTGATG